MHTRLSDSNPHGYNYHGFAWEHVPEGSAAHLEFGCGDGMFLDSLRRKEIERLVGLDISREAIGKARASYPDLDFRQITRTTPLPFEAGSFDSITIIEVLEHVVEQEALLAELARVLRDDGTLIVTVPRKSAFSFLDPGNLKFRFPRLHRWYYSRKHGVKAYERRYVCNPDGLVGDISAEKRWHEHISRRKLRRLLEEQGLEVVEFDGIGLFIRPMWLCSLLWRKVGFLYRLSERVITWDRKMWEWNNLFCVARKSGR